MAILDTDTPTELLKESIKQIAFLSGTDHEVFSVVPRLPAWSLVARIIHESAAPTVDMTALPGVLGPRNLHRTLQVRLGFEPLRLPGGTAIYTVSRHRLMNDPDLRSFASGKAPPPCSRLCSALAGQGLPHPQLRK